MEEPTLSILGTTQDRKTGDFSNGNYSILLGGQKSCPLKKGSQESTGEHRREFLSDISYLETLREEMLFFVHGTKKVEVKPEGKNSI